MLENIYISVWVVEKKMIKRKNNWNVEVTLWKVMETKCVRYYLEYDMMLQKGFGCYRVITKMIKLIKFYFQLCGCCKSNWLKVTWHKSKENHHIVKSWKLLWADSFPLVSPRSLPWLWLVALLRLRCRRPSDLEKNNVKEIKQKI